MSEVIIEKGLLKSLSNPDIEVIEHLIPTSNQSSRPGHSLDPESITIHNTANPGASAEANSKYVDTTENYVSWHLTVGNKIVYQELPFNEVAWHAGDGSNGEGNRTSIAIEVAEVDGAYETAIEVVRDLCEAFNFDVYTQIVPHKLWSGKECPRLILPIWDEFIDEISTVEVEEPKLRLLGVLDKDYDKISFVNGVKGQKIYVEDPK